MKILRFLLPLLVLGAAAGVVVLLMATKPEPERRAPPPSVTTVDAIRLQPQDYKVIIESQGEVTARTQSTLKPQVSGEILSISPNFRQGGIFEAGEVLITIDPRDYQTAVTASEANLKQREALLELEKAQHEQAAENWKQLGDGSAPSPLTLRKPQLIEAQALVEATQSQLAEAKRNLDRTQIRAPYAGRIRTKLADIGQFVSSGNSLAEIFAIDYVEIRLPLENRELDFLDLPELYRGEHPEEHSPENPKVALFGDYGSRRVRWEGTVVRTEGVIDRHSRELFVVAHVRDPYRHTSSLTPPIKVGQFVNAEIQGKTLADVFVLPAKALIGKNTVLIVDEENKLWRREVEPVWKSSREVVVRDNLKPGELLCTTAIEFAVNGISVRPRIEGEEPPSGKPGQGRGPGGMTASPNHNFTQKAAGKPIQEKTPL